MTKANRDSPAYGRNQYFRGIIIRPDICDYLSPNRSSALPVKRTAGRSDALEPSLVLTFPLVTAFGPNLSKYGQINGE
jgi:hypothetical protein